MLRGVDQLENTPEILRLLMSGLSEEDVMWKPAPDRFSIAEVLEHLSHAEGHCYRLRLDQLMAGDRPEWAACEDKHQTDDPEESFAHFEEQREDNIEFLNSLEEEDARRVGIHPVLGPITLAEMLNEWAFHDLGHIRQIAELVRARKFHPGMGAYRDTNPVKP